MSLSARRPTVRPRAVSGSRWPSWITVASPGSCACGCIAAGDGAARIGSLSSGTGASGAGELTAAAALARSRPTAVPAAGSKVPGRLWERARSGQRAHARSSDPNHRPLREASELEPKTTWLARRCVTQTQFERGASAPGRMRSAGGTPHTEQPIPAMAVERHMTRRTFLGGAAAAVGASTLGPAALAAPARRRQFDHVVVVMMENRSFDHLLGWLPGADGRQAGLTYVDAAGAPHPTHALAPDFQGCAHPDPDHSYAGGRAEFNGGACDGWLRAGTNDDYAIGYYRQSDLAFLGRAVPDWTTFSRYFAPIMAETYPNRIYQHAGQTDRIVNTTQISRLPTIWDRLAEKGRTRRYYFSDVPFLALWGTKYLRITRPIAGFYADAAAGRLPNVAFVDPRFVDEGSGTARDDHPHADLRYGEAFM